MILFLQPEFGDPGLSFVSVFDMALGGLNYVDRFVISDIKPFRIDNLIIFTIFMVIVPISLMNLLIGVAVGDIDAIQSQAKMKLVTLRVRNFLVLFSVG